VVTLTKAITTREQEALDASPWYPALGQLFCKRGWCSASGELRSDFRQPEIPDFQSNPDGFRLATNRMQVIREKKMSNREDDRKKLFQRYLDFFNVKTDFIADEDLDNDQFLTWEDAILEEAGREKLLGPPEGVIELPDGSYLLPPVMKNVPAGTFIMGSDDEMAWESERPAHEEYVDDFAIAQVPVTQELYEAVVGTNPSGFIGRRRPVECVSWYDAVNFCNLLSEICGLEKPYAIDGNNVEWDQDANGYRLPTEAEWEKAARGTDGRRYPWGNDPPDETKARYNSEDTADVATHTAGRSPYGCDDMAGNVWEWCADGYDPDAYKKKLEARERNGSK